MARKSNDGGVNKSAEIRDLFAKNPDIKVRDLIATLGAKGIEVKPNLVYLIKGKLKGEERHPRGNRGGAAKSAAASKSGDALATIMKVKKVADEVGGMRTLKALIDALSE
jgi:hypothetical protein